MRLSEFEKTSILTIARSFDPHCKIYLYGSRVDDSLKGGDIDLLLLSEQIGFTEKISLLVEIKKQIGDQKIDLLVKTTEQALKDAFVQSIKNTAIELN